VLDDREAGLVDDPADSPSPVHRTTARVTKALALVRLQAPLVAPLVAELLELVIEDMELVNGLLTQALDDEARLVGMIPEQPELVA
jgi:hypothetical protein